jgi:biopolymer transport protein ExbD
MKRLRKYSERVATKLDEPRLSVAPLVDVCFLLMVYFMVTTTIVPAERDVSTEIPAPGVKSTRVPSVSVMLHVQKTGWIVLNPGNHEIVISRDPSDRELPKLEGFLSTLMVGLHDLPPLMVRADGEAQHQRVVDVMNVLSKIGWTRVGFLDEAD